MRSINKTNRNQQKPTETNNPICATMSISTKYRSNPHVHRDTNQTLTIQRKAFACNIAQTVNGVIELSRYIASVSAYITSDKLTLDTQCLASVNKNATITLLEENGWDHRCSTYKDFNPSNLFTEGKGISANKTISMSQGLGSSSISSPKTIAQLMTQRSTLTNTLPARDYMGHIVFSDAPKTTNALSGKKTMGDNAFASCTGLSSVRMSSDNSWNGFYSNGCFKSCSSLTTINTVANSNSSMSFNVGVTPPPGTISVSAGDTVVYGTATLFTSLRIGQMVYTSSDTREGAKYIGTLKSIQHNTQMTLSLPSALGSYSGTFRVTTEAMIELCKSRTDIEAQTFCYGFGEGVYQGYLLGRNTKEAPTICLPPQGVSRDEVLAEFIKWAMERPQYSQDKAAVTIMRFLPVRFPC